MQAASNPQNRMKEKSAGGMVELQEENYGGGGDDGNDKNEGMKNIEEEREKK